MPDLHPALVLLVGALAVGVVPRRFGAALTVLTGLLALAATIGLDEGTSWTLGFYSYELTWLRADELSLVFATVFALIIAIAGVYGWATMGRLEQAAALATAGCGIGVVLAGDLLTLFFFWELKVATATLLIVARRHPSASAAGLRYLGVHLVGGVLLLGGILGHLHSTGSLAFGAFELTAATGFVLAGFCVSAAAVPVHAWLPDSYPESTVAGTVVLSAFTTKSAVYVLARGFAGLDLLVWLGVAMAILGVVYAVLEDDIRRLLSYHIVSQVGFMVAAIGVGTDAAVNGATAHATAHVLYKGLLLMGVGAVLYVTGRSRASELGGLARALPVVLGLYLVGAFSISGVPLFSGFPAKELAVASVGEGSYAAQWLLKLASVGTFLSVAIKLPALTWFGEPRSASGAGPAPIARSVPVTMYAAMGVTAALNVAIGVAPGLLYDRMPTTVAFEPYTVAKVVEVTMLLGFTGLGTWLVWARLAPAAKVNVDTDWVYRELPALVWRRVADRRIAGRGIAGRPVERWGRRPRLPEMPGAPTRPVVPSWVLGGAIVGAMVLVLAVSVTS